MAPLADHETHAYFGAPVEHYLFTQGATAWRYTSADIESAIDDGAGTNTYAPLADLNRKAMDFSQEADAANIEVTMPTTAAVAQLFVPGTPPTKMSLVIRRKHRTDDEVAVWFVGTVTSVDFEDGEARLTCAPISASMKRLVPALVTSSACNWVWGGGLCAQGVDIEDYREAGSVSAVAGAQVTADLFGTHADGYYRNGWIERANGERRGIVAHVGTTVTLRAPFRDLAVAEDFDAFPGCPHSEAGCITFGDPPNGNILNQLAWPRIPSRNPYGGGSLV